MVEVRLQCVAKSGNVSGNTKKSTKSFINIIKILYRNGFKQAWIWI